MDLLEDLVSSCVFVHDDPTRKFKIQDSFSLISVRLISILAMLSL